MQNIDGPQDVPGAAKLFGGHANVPVQTSATSQGPTAARQTVPTPAMVPVSTQMPAMQVPARHAPLTMHDIPSTQDVLHAADAPVQVPPAHAVPAAMNASAGQPAPTPLHVSAKSHASNAARQTVPAAA